MMTARFVSEPLKPLHESGMVAAPPGAPVLPRAFRWRGADYPVLGSVETWRDTGPCTHGSGERYVRKHWYRFQTAGGAVWTVYFRRRGGTGARWVLYEVDTIPSGASA